MNHLREQWAAVVEASAGPANVGFPPGFVFEPPLYRSKMSPGQRVIVTHPDMEGAEVGGIITGEIPTAGVMVVRLDGMKAPNVVHIPLSMVKAAARDQSFLDSLTLIEHRDPADKTRNLQAQMEGQWGPFTVGVLEVYGTYYNEPGLSEAEKAASRYQGRVSWIEIIHAEHRRKGVATFLSSDLSDAGRAWMHSLGSLDEVRLEMEHHVPDEFGSWACFDVAPRIERKWGYPAVEGFYAPEGDVDEALDTERLYTHWWNVLPDGRILDATAGQWRRGQGNVEVLPANDARYVLWEDVPVQRRDEALALTEWSHFTGSRHQASKVPVYRGINVEMSHEQFDRYLAEAARGGTGFGFILDIIKGYIPQNQWGTNAGVHWTSSKAEAHEFATGGPKGPFGIGKYLKGNAYSKGNVAVVMIGEVDAADVVTDPEVLQRYWVLDREQEVPLREGASILLRGIEVAVPVSIPDSESWSLGSRDPVRWVPVNGRISLTAVAGVTPEQLAFMNRVRAECQQTFGDAMVCREVTKALADEYGWTVESGYYHGPGHDIRPTYGAFPGHRYIRQPDGSILDVTHDQYEPGLPLLVIPPGDPRQGWYQKIGKTAAAKTQKVKDPILGWRWVIVCDFHGVIGRWETEAEAEAALPKHQNEGDLRVGARRASPPKDPNRPLDRPRGIQQCVNCGRDIFFDASASREWEWRHVDTTYVQCDRQRKESSTWRGFSGEGRTLWNEHDVVILSQRRGRERYFETYINGQNFRNFPRLDEAKAGLEAKLGPLDWKQEKMDKVWVEHYYFGWTPEFTDPLIVYYADL